VLGHLPSPFTKSSCPSLPCLPTQTLPIRSFPLSHRSSGGIRRNMMLQHANGSICLFGHECCLCRADDRYALPKKPVATPVHLAPPQPTRTNSAISSTSPRRALTRANTTVSPAPPPQIVGTRRTNPYSETSGGSSSRAIEVGDSESDSDMEVVGDTVTSNGHGRSKDRPTKRTRINGSGRNGDGAGPGSDDIIVIDD
jgi:hypothetical protein